MSMVSATKSGPTSVSSVSSCQAGIVGGDMVGFWGKERLEKYSHKQSKGGWLLVIYIFIYDIIFGESMYGKE